ncbi:MAG TPA: hypothetical protein VM533_16235 [Fimbriiglobus sp.]|jgi:hypothetical protein|nr:hypothetical protein [Fimbriiglobus sp.]
MMRRLLRLSSPLLAVVGLLATGNTATAGWDNVFQVCCHDCKSKPIRSFFRAQGCDDCAPQPTQRVEYQRSYYYEPVTVMKPERFTEAVPVQVRSYYWEPVTSYTRASYYDPCTGCCQDICVPRTSYVRKEKCDTVTRYIERCRMVPVQVQRKVEVTRPVVTYYGPEVRRYLPADCELPPAGVAGPAPVGPRVDELRVNPPSVTPESGGNIAPQQLPITEGSRRRVLPPTRPQAGTVNAHTTSRTGPASLRGEIVQSDQVTPRPGAKLVFVSAADHNRREYVTADRFGNFDLRLPAGDWHVYLGNGDGRAVYHKKITVGAYDAREFTVVSR